MYQMLSPQLIQMMLAAQRQQQAQGTPGQLPGMPGSTGMLAPTTPLGAAQQSPMLGPLNGQMVQPPAQAGGRLSAPPTMAGAPPGLMEQLYGQGGLPQLLQALRAASSPGALSQRGLPQPQASVTT